MKTNASNNHALTLHTDGSPGLVENLSLFSPCSSNKSMTRSVETTAILALLGDQAIAVIFAAPS